MAYFWHIADFEIVFDRSLNQNSNRQILTTSRSLFPHEADLFMHRTQGCRRDTHSFLAIPGVSNVLLRRTGKFAAPELRVGIEFDPLNLLKEAFRRLGSWLVSSSSTVRDVPPHSERCFGSIL
jgi:hypothetical protein